MTALQYIEVAYDSKRKRPKYGAEFNHPEWYLESLW